MKIYFTWIGHSNITKNEKPMFLKKKNSDFPGGPVAGTELPNAWGPGFIPGDKRTRSHVPQLRVWTLKSPQLKIKDPKCRHEDPVWPNR